MLESYVRLLSLSESKSDAEKQTIDILLWFARSLTRFSQGVYSLHFCASILLTYLL